MRPDEPSSGSATRPSSSSTTARPASTARPPRRRGGARLPLLPEPDRRATSGSTSRATRSSSPRAGSSTSSAGATATTPARCGYDALWARDRDDERARLRASSSTSSSSAAAATPGCTSTTTRLRAHRAHAPHGRARDARGRDRRPPARRGARRPLPRVRAGAPRLDLELLDQGVEELYGFERTAEVEGGDESVVSFETWLETGDDSLLDEIGATTRRTAARRSSCTTGCSRSGRRDVPWRAPPEQREPKEETEERDAARAALRERAARGRRGGRAALAPRAPPRLPPARGAAAVVGVLPLPQLDEEELDRATATAIGGLELGGEPARGQAVATSTRSRSRRRSTRSAARPSIRRPRSRSGVTVDDEHGSSRSAASIEQARTSRCRAALIPPQPIGDKVQRDALLRFASAYADGQLGAYPALVDDPRAAPADVRARRDARRRRRCSLDGELPLRAGPARLGEDVARRADGDRADAAGQRVGVTSLSHKAIHKFLARDRARGARAGLRVPRRSRSAREADDALRRRRRSRRRSVERQRRHARPGATSSSPARPGCSRARRSTSDGRAPLDTLFVDEARPVRARRRARGRDGRAQPRPARRPEPAAAGLAGLASARAGPLGARAPARRARDRAARPRALPRADVAAAARALRVHLGGVLRGAARAGAGRGAPIARGRGRAPSSSRSSTQGHSAVVAGGGGGGRRPRSSGCSGRRSPTRRGATRPLEPRRLPRRRAVQRAGARAAREAAGGASASARSTSSRGSRRRSSSSRWRARRARRRRAGSTSRSSHRLNVAISRAQCRAVLVCAPALLDADCTTIEQMRLVSAVAGSWSWRANSRPDALPSRARVVCEGGAPCRPRARSSGSPSPRSR